MSAQINILIGKNVNKLIGKYETFDLSHQLIYPEIGVDLQYGPYLKHPDIYLETTVESLLSLSKGGTLTAVNMFTGSEYLINYIGQKVEEGFFKGVVIKVFVHDDDNVVTHNSYYSDEGYLKEWPIGWFQPSIY